MLFADAAPETWIALAFAIGSSLIAALSAGWQLYLGYLERKGNVQERLSACEEDRANLKARVETLEEKVG